MKYSKIFQILVDYKKTILLFAVFIFTISFNAQNKFNNFFKPSDSININRRNAVLISETILGTVTLLTLNELWYKNYPKSDFQFINDNSEWLQMDKAGHIFSSYHLGNTSKNALKWSGIKKENQLIYGATFGFLFLSAVEVLDGYSEQWGASTGDIIANATGTAMVVSQELLWNEQRIVPKFSFHTTKYASIRPNLLGSNLNEQILKDYNGQTYWLSANLHSFFKKSKIPVWLNLALGYGGEGMISGNIDFLDQNPTFLESRRRQFYISFDIDFTKIRTKSNFLKTFFSVINTIKIPAPSVEVSSGGVVNFYCLYF
jgi:uncharacterized protein YfiM (DUF2279 family)